MYYPLFLDLRRSRCLIVGAGRVGRRKLADLLAADPVEILVLDPGLTQRDLGPAGEDPRVVFASRPFIEADVSGRRLVFAASSDAGVNRAVAEACARHGVLCNCADAPELGDFLVPAQIRRERIVVALSTQGASPALARRLREELEQRLDQGFVPLAELLARLRPLVLAMSDDSEQNAELFRKVAFSSLHKALQGRDKARCETLLRELLPPDLHPRLTELLHGLL